MKIFIRVERYTLFALYGSKGKGRVIVGPADPTSGFDVSTLPISSKCTPKRGGAVSLVAKDSDSNGVTAVRISSNSKDLVLVPQKLTFTL